jgi:hypothetical protein
MDLSDFDPDDVARAREHVLRGTYEPLELDFAIGDLAHGVSVVPLRRHPQVQHSDVVGYLDRGHSWGWIQADLERIRALRAGSIDEFQLQLDDDGLWAFREGVVGFFALPNAGPPKAVHTLGDFEKALVDLADAQVRHYSIALSRRESVSPALEIRREGDRWVVRESEEPEALARVIEDLANGDQHLIGGFIARIQAVMDGQEPHDVLWFSDSEVFVYPEGAVIPGESRRPGGVRVLKLDELIAAFALVGPE